MRGEQIGDITEKKSILEHMDAKYLIEMVYIKMLLAIIILAFCMQYTQLTVSTWNLRGLTSSKPYLHTLLESSSVVCLQEHWLYNCDKFKLSDLHPDYESHIVCSNDLDPTKYGTIGGKGTGGVAILWHTSIDKHVRVLKTINHDRVCGIEITTTSGRKLFVLSVYLPTKGTKTSANFSDVLDYIELKVREFQSEGMYV